MEGKRVKCEKINWREIIRRVFRDQLIVHF
jgi:hypothetical protein